MSKGKGGSAPKAPDYANLAKQDAEQQRITAGQITQSNRPNQTDRFGNQLTWSQTPDGQWSQSVTLSPEEQYRQNAAMYSQSQGLNLAMNQPGFQYDQLGYSQPGRADIGFGNASVRPGMQAGPAPSSSGGAKGGIMQPSGGAQAPVSGGTKGAIMGSSGGAGQQAPVGIKGGTQASGTPRPAWADWEKETDLTKRMDMLNQAGLMSEIPGMNPYFPNGRQGGGLSLGAGGGNQSGTPQQMGGPQQMGSSQQMVGQGGPSTGGRADPGYFTNQAGAIGNFDSTQGDKVAADLYESVMGRARPEQAREQARLDNQLRNQGLQPGTAAYDRAMQNLMTSHGDVSTQAGLNSTLAGYGAAKDIYNTNLGGQGQRFDQQLGGWGANLSRQGQLTNQGLARDSLNQQGNIASEAAALARAGQQQSEQGQRFNQNYQSYLLPFQQAQYMQQMGQNAMNPLDFQGFLGATGYNPASMSDAAQNKYNAQMGGYNANQNMKGNTMGLAGTLGSAGIMAMSDAALKEDIRPLVGEDALKAILELGGFSYSWKSTGERDMGLIAQQVQATLPALVEHTESGHLAVYYTGVVAIAVEAIKYLAERLNELH